MSTMEYKENNTMLEHIRRPESINPALADAFQSVVKLAMTNPGIAMRIVFRKSDGSIRTMDVAFDEHMKDAFSPSLTQAQADGNANRRATNASRRNLVVRERIKENGEYRFQWRTIPLERIMSVSPCL